PHRPRLGAIRRLMHVAGIPVPEEPQRARQIGEASSSSAISDSEDSSSSGEDSDNHDVAPEPEPTPVEPDALPCAEVPMDEESHPPVLPDEVPVQEHALPVGESRVHADDGGGEPTVTPPKHYKHDVQNVFGFWVCKQCKGEARTLTIMQSMPCNAAIVEKMKEIERLKQIKKQMDILVTLQALKEQKERVEEAKIDASISKLDAVVSAPCLDTDETQPLSPSVDIEEIAKTLAVPPTDPTCKQLQFDLKPETPPKETEHPTAEPPKVDQKQLKLDPKPEVAPPLKRKATSQLEKEPEAPEPNPDQLDKPATPKQYQPLPLPEKPTCIECPKKSIQPISPQQQLQSVKEKTQTDEPDDTDDPGTKKVAGKVKNEAVSSTEDPAGDTVEDQAIEEVPEGPPRKKCRTKRNQANKTKSKGKSKKTSRKAKRKSKKTSRKGRSNSKHGKVKTSPGDNDPEDPPHNGSTVVLLIFVGSMELWALRQLSAMGCHDMFLFTVILLTFTDNVDLGLRTQFFECFSGQAAVSRVFKREGVPTVSYDIEMAVYDGGSPGSTERTVWKASFWMAHYGLESAKRTIFWGNSEELMASMATDKELFQSMPLGDTWPEAELIQTWAYLYRNKHLKIPDSWQSTLKEFHETLMDSVLAEDPGRAALRAAYWQDAQTQRDL
ncbi:unnamed protein product, partial [Cladocopium goreaui]